MIRWSVQKGFITIPKSSRQERIIENADVFDWSISESDMSLLVRYHYENTPMQYTEIFKAVKMKIFIKKKLMFFMFLLKT